MSDLADILEKDYGIPRNTPQNKITVFIYSLISSLVSLLVISWGWNTVFHDIYGLPPLLHFYQVVAVFLLLKQVGRNS
jgi:hypothetical protein